MVDINKRDEIAEAYCNQFFDEMDDEEKEIVRNLGSMIQPDKIGSACQWLATFGFVMSLDSNPENIRLTSLGYRLAYIERDRRLQLKQ